MREMTNERVEEEVRRQMRIIGKGAAEIVGEEELYKKLERSIRENRPLNVKLGLDPSGTCGCPAQAEADTGFGASDKNHYR